jgi:hypothetical protein
LGFVGIWVWIVVKLFTFDATTEEPELVLSTAFTTVSGALSVAVGAGTAAVLGIEVQKKINETGASFAMRVFRGATASRLVIAGVVSYSVVGARVIIAWLDEGDAAPEVVESFAIGALGWMAGAFLSVFAASG